MANKIFGFYSDSESMAGKGGNQLIIETGNTHFACLVKNDADETITAFEWFKHSKDDTRNFDALFTSIKQASRLLDQYYAQQCLFVNNEFGMLVPPALFKKDSVDDYLDVVMGEKFKTISLHNEVSVGEGFVNVFRVYNEITDVLNRHLLPDKVQHTYGQVLKQIYSIGNIPPTFIKVQFYDSEIIVAILKNGKLQFMQSFTYQSPEDVLYYLLSLCQRLQLNIGFLAIKVSGMIDLHTPLYGQLVKYFHNVSVETVDPGRISFDTGDYPSHYFTPIYNLAL